MATGIYLRSKYSYSGSILQAVAEIMFQLGDKGNGIYEKGKGNNYINGRNVFLLVEIT